MTNVVPFPFGGGDSGGSTLEHRVMRLEADVREIRVDIRDVRDRISNIEERLARIEGGFEAIHHRLNALPTLWTFTIALVAAVIAASGLSLTIAKMALP